jgi:hypothetical protein
MSHLAITDLGERGDPIHASSVVKVLTGAGHATLMRSVFDADRIPFAFQDSDNDSGGRAMKRQPNLAEHDRTGGKRIRAAVR